MHASVCMSVFNFCFPSYYHVPIDVTAEWAASLVYTLYQVPIYTAGQTGACNQQQSVMTGQTCNLSINRPTMLTAVLSLSTALSTAILVVSAVQVGLKVSTLSSLGMVKSHLWNTSPPQVDLPALALST